MKIEAMVVPKMMIISAFLLIFLLLSATPAHAQQGLGYSIRVIDPNNRLGADGELVKLNLIAAIREWAQYLDRVAALDIEVRVLDHTVSGRFGGRSECGVWCDYNGQKVVEEGAPHKMRTGEDANGAKADVIIDLEPEFMRRSYWIDPEPFQRTTAVPRNKIDLITAFAHELGHAFGINGRRDLMTGEVRAGDSPSLFDAHMIDPTSSTPAFRGPATNALYGADLPLTYFRQSDATISFTSSGRQYRAGISNSQNFYHYGRYTVPNESPLSLFGLMAGGWPYPNPSQGLRIPVGRLDVAILRDLGVPTR